MIVGSKWGQNVKSIIKMALSRTGERADKHWYINVLRTEVHDERRVDLVFYVLICVQNHYYIIIYHLYS